MYFIGSFEYRVTFLVKIRRFNGHRKWTSWANIQADRLYKRMTLINTNVVASRYIKREEVSVAVRHSKTPELNLNFNLNENVTHSAQGETVFWGGEFSVKNSLRSTTRRQRQRHRFCIFNEAKQKLCTPFTCFYNFCTFLSRSRVLSSPGGGGGMCRCEGYGFQAVYSSIGYINQSVWV